MAKTKSFKGPAEKHFEIHIKTINRQVVSRLMFRDQKDASNFKSQYYSPALEYPSQVALVDVFFLPSKHCYLLR